MVRAVPEDKVPVPRKDVTRNRIVILDAAREIFRQDGLMAPMDRIAKTAGVGGATLYRHFPDRAAIWDAVLRGPLERILVLVNEALALNEKGAGLVHYLVGVGELEAGPEGFAAVMTTRYIPESGLALLRGDIQNRIQELVDRAHTDGSLRADATETDIALLTLSLEAIISATRHVAPRAWRRLLYVALEGFAPTSVAIDPVTALRPNEMWRAFTQSPERSKDTA